MPIDFLSDEFSPVQNEPAGRDFLAEPQKESYSTSAALAIPRTATDFAKGLYKFAQNIPEYYRKSQTEIPGAFNVISQNPQHAMKQGLAGVAEMGKNIFNTPHDIVNYLSTRLNLVPEDINRKVQMARMPEEETQNAINSQFGQPVYEGENLIRGIGRNAINVLGAKGAVNAISPFNPTISGITKNIINTLDKQVSRHSEKYNKLWKAADKSGFNNVSFDPQFMNNNLALIKKSYTPKQYGAVEEFMNNPTLERAQKAQSDIGVLKRAIEEKSKKTPLLDAETNLHKALEDTERHIEGNMFKNQSGNINQGLLNRYNKITKSYATNVVPYRYNPSIQDYLSKKITKKQLVNQLSSGPFAATKGNIFNHPGLKIRNEISEINPLLLTGGLGGAAYLANLLGIGNSENK